MAFFKTLTKCFIIFNFSCLIINSTKSQKKYNNISINKDKVNNSISPFQNLSEYNSKNISKKKNFRNYSDYIALNQFLLSSNKSQDLNISNNNISNLSKNKKKSIEKNNLTNIIQNKSEDNFNMSLNISLQNKNVTNNSTKYSLRQNVAIAYALNNQYFYPTLVSITSILENSKNSTLNYIFLLTGKNNLTNYYKNKFKDLEKKYKNCKINFVEIDDKIFYHANTKRYPITAYYRLLLAELILEFNRILYLDSDTLIFNDLTELINLDMEDNIAMGWVDNGFKNAIQFNLTTYKYITSGVILFDLKQIREKNITKQFLDFIDKNSKYLNQEDQTVINIVLHNKIGFLPPKYGVWAFRFRKALIEHNNYKNISRGIKCYFDEDIIKAWHNPAIIHYVQSKPWLKINYFTNTRFRKSWWHYAMITGEYVNITKTYKIYF